MRRPEDQLQAAICDWLAIQERMGRLLYFAVPNAAKRSVKLATLLKRTGLRRGFPDMAVILRGRIIFLELKAGKNKETDDQEWWAERLTAFGFEVHTVRSLDQLQVIVNGRSAVSAAGMVA